MTRCPSLECPTPTPPASSGAGGADRQGEGSTLGPCPQLHTKPFTFSLPSKLLPGLRFSEGLGCPLRWSAGRSHQLSQRCLLPRVSAASSPPLATDPGASSAWARGRGGTEPPPTPPRARGLCAPGERTAVRCARHNFAQPLRHPLTGAQPIPAATGSGPGQPHPQAAVSPAAATLLPARRGARAARAPAGAPRAARLPLCCGGGGRGLGWQTGRPPG